MRKVIFVVSISVSLLGCVTTSGVYRVTAVKKDRTSVPIVMDVRGAHIYAARNAICSANPGATVSIVDIDTGKELLDESPYRCK
jgi:hypothetical protein